MKSRKLHILFSIIVIFMLTTSMSSVSFAEKPQSAIEIEVPATTPSDSVTFHYSWENFSAFRITACVYQYEYVDGNYVSTSYTIGNILEELEKVTRNKEGELTIPLSVYNPSFPLSGSYGKIQLIIFNKNNSRTTGAFSAYFLIEE